MFYRDDLDELQDKINKIEDEDENFRENKKWIKYRRQQDFIYDMKRKEMEGKDGRGF